MSKLLEKYEDFLKELELTIEPFQKLSERESFSMEECFQCAQATAGTTLLQHQEGLVKDAISCIYEALEYFKEVE